MPLDDRKFLILQAIIDDYLTTAMPVGSRTISRKSGVMCGEKWEILCKNILNLLNPSKLCAIITFV